MNSLYPFRSKNKRPANLAEASIPPPVPKYMPKHQRKYSLMHVHGPLTWMIDFMLLDGKHILNLIHCNSRFWLPFMCRREGAQAVINALNILLRLPIPGLGDRPIDTLISDAAKVFTTTDVVRDVCRHLGIKQIVYNMSDGGKQIVPELKSPTTTQYHNQLAIIDRISKTLRDMVETVQRTQPSFELTPRTLKQLGMIYNRTPHETLSKLMGFKVCPRDVLSHKKLHDEIVRRIVMKNLDTIESPSFDINVGAIVYLYAPKQLFEKRRNTVESSPYVVIARNKGNYIIRRLNDETAPPITVQRKDIVQR